MFLNGISIYYCFLCPLSSIVVLACHSLFLHQFAIPLPPVCHLLQIKVTGFFFCGAKLSNAAWCGHTFPVMPPPSVVPLLDFGVPLFFRTLICWYRLLIYFACASTMSTNTSKLAENYAIGHPFATAWVAAESMLSRYPFEKIQHLVWQWGWHRRCNHL